MEVPNPTLRSRLSAVGANSPSVLANRLVRWFVAQARDLPWRRTRDPYAIWISEVMLQQTQVKTVIPYWSRWMAAFPTVQDLADAGIDQILKLWSGLGYYTRARNLHRAARIIAQQHGGQLPMTFAELIGLPGIGRYTAGAICSIAFHQPRPVLDGNVTRVLARVFGLRQDPRQTNTQARLWRLAADLVQEAGKTRVAGHPACGELNQALMELGAVVCAPRQPECPVCPVRICCVARIKELIRQIPKPRTRQSSQVRHRICCLVAAKDCFLVWQRPENGINAGLWEFPGIDVNGLQARPELLIQELLGRRPQRLIQLGEIRHTITHNRIRLTIYRAEFRRSRVTGFPRRFAWKSWDELRSLAFTGAHRKILARITPRPAPELTNRL